MLWDDRLALRCATRSESTHVHPYRSRHTIKVHTTFGAVCVRGVPRARSPRHRRTRTHTTTTQRLATPRRSRAGRRCHPPSHRPSRSSASPLASASRSVYPSTSWYMQSVRILSCSMVTWSSLSRSRSPPFSSGTLKMYLTTIDIASFTSADMPRVSTASCASGSAATYADREVEMAPLPSASPACSWPSSERSASASPRSCSMYAAASTSTSRPPSRVTTTVPLTLGGEAVPAAASSAGSAAPKADPPSPSSAPSAAENSSHAIRPSPSASMSFMSARAS
mmetsp:Transcript_22263/g.65607  ORF Transcript_22263/g.65607 Transcript_22263/m.65607 type:complete len:281 (+) Transcript_22263:492-1334(+)